MIWHIAKKDFLDNFTSARFIVGFLLCLFLIPFTVYTGTRIYENRVEKYQRDLRQAEEEFTKAQVYAQIQPVAVKPPSPLSIFCKGISEQTGSQAVLKNDEVPTFASGITTMYENQFLNRFISLDFINILVIILSLIGILLTYDIFSRERENGTLRLVLSNRLSRADLFFGKAAGVLITFVPLLLICYVLVFIILSLSPAVHLVAGDYGRIVLLFLFSLLYLSLFVFLGSYISSKVRSSSTSLIINLFIWCILVFLLPNAMSYLGKNMVKTGNYGMVRLNMNDLDNAFWEDYGSIMEQVHKEGYKTDGYEVCAGWNYGGIMVCFTPRENMECERRRHELVFPVVLDYADKKWQLQRDYLDGLYRQQRVIKYFSCLSPSEIMKYVSASLCKTGMEDHVYFMDQARQYRNTFYTYYEEEEIHGGYSYFTPHDESEFPEDRAEGRRMQHEWRQQNNPSSTFDLASLGYVTTSTLPRFTYSEKGIMCTLLDQLWLLAGMILGCVVLTGLTYRSFIKYDIR